MNFNIIDIEEIDSTNSFALKQFSVGELKGGDVILANYQTSGRGQTQNSWESEKGMNLTFSIVLEPKTIDASKQFLITQVVSLAIFNTLQGIVNSNELSIKWPNDIYFGNKKIAGILVQNIITGNKISCSIIGIGLNVNQERFISDAPNPISIKNIFGNELDTQLLLKSLLYTFSETHKLILTAESVYKLKREYLLKLYKYNVEHTYLDKGGRFSGTIRDVDEYGRLIIIDHSQSERKYMFKEVEFLIDK